MINLMKSERLKTQMLHYTKIACDGEIVDEIKKRNLGGTKQRWWVNCIFWSPLSKAEAMSEFTYVTYSYLKQDLAYGVMLVPADVV